MFLTILVTQGDGNKHNLIFEGINLIGITKLYYYTKCFLKDFRMFYLRVEPQDLIILPL